MMTSARAACVTSSRSSQNSCAGEASRYAQAVPHLIGRTRFLVNFEPQHRERDGICGARECRRALLRSQSQSRSGPRRGDRVPPPPRLTASSPDIEGRREVEEEEGVNLDETSSSSMLGIEIRADLAEHYRRSFAARQSRGSSRRFSITCSIWALPSTKSSRSAPDGSATCWRTSRTTPMGAVSIHTSSAADTS
jgi:hypothetical protein